MYRRLPGVYRPATHLVVVLLINKKKAQQCGRQLVVTVWDGNSEGLRGQDSARVYVACKASAKER